MARRKERLSDSLILAPWWVSVALAVLSYVGLAGVVPKLQWGHPIIQALAREAARYAWLVSGLFLFLGFLSFVRARWNAHLFDQQKDLESVRALHWKEFENLIAEYYRRKGFQVQEKLGGGADDGIDLTLRKGSDKTIVQCKRWGRKPVPVQVIRELYGVMTAERAKGGVLMTTSTFTNEAIRFAEDKPIELIAGEQLLRFIQSVQASQSSRSIEPPAAVTPDPHPACPECGKPMVKRTARRGPSAGQEFFGCSNYPSCRGTRPLS